MKRTMVFFAKTSHFAKKLNTNQIFSALLCMAIVVWVVLLVGFNKGIYSPTILYKDNYAVSCKAFTALNIPLKEIKVQVWGQINTEEKKNGLENIYNQAAAHFMLDKENVEIKDNKDTILLKQQETFPQGCLHLVLQSPSGGSASPICYYNFLYTTTNTEKAREIYQQFTAFLEKFAVKSDIGVTFSGSVPGFITEVDCSRRAKKAARTVQAKMVEGIQGETLTSISFYTPRGGRWAEVKGRKINLQVALHYDKSQDETNIYVGAPLIYQDY